MGLIVESLNHTLDSLVGKCFYMNRILDRGVSLLNVKFKLPNTAEVLHYHGAHVYLGDKFADAIADYQALRDNETMYPATVAGDDVFDKPLSVFLKFHSENLSFENMVLDAIDQANDIGDFATKHFLEKILDNLTEMTGLSKLLVDIFTDCDNDRFKLLMADSVIKEYIQ